MSVWKLEKHLKDEVIPALEAAITNEGITRRRVSTVEDVLRRGFWGRFRWLVLGR